MLITRWYDTVNSIYEEINGKIMSDEQVGLYLERLGMEKPQQPDLSYLTALQQAHISRIPFENLDIMAKKPISLEREALFEKIILRRRGGVCSELNTLYNWLLVSLGYETVSYSSRIIAEKSPVQPRSHRVIAAAIDGERYLTDVGFNYEHHRVPLMLREELVQEDGECRYRLTKDEFFGWLMWQERPGYGWRKKLGFTEDPCIDMDFAAATFYAQEHSASKINKYLKVSMHIDGTFYAIRSGMLLKELGGVEHVIEKIESPQRQKEILHDVFHL